MCELIGIPNNLLNRVWIKNINTPKNLNNTDRI